MTDIDVSKYNVTEDGQVLRNTDKKENEELKEYYHKKLTTEYANHNKEISELKKLYQSEKNKYVECLTECLCLREENEKLKGYKNIVDTIKAEGFESFCEVKMFLQHHKELEEEIKRLKENQK